MGVPQNKPEPEPELKPEKKEERGDPNYSNAWQSGKSVQCADFKSDNLSYLGFRAKDEASYSVIRLGQRLVELKDTCQHGEFMKIAEECCGLKASQCQNLMRIYREFGQMPTAVGFSTIALLELSKADDPQAALVEAEKQESSVTAKQATTLLAYI